MFRFREIITSCEKDMSLFTYIMDGALYSSSCHPKNFSPYENEKFLSNITYYLMNNKLGNGLVDDDQEFIYLRGSGDVGKWFHVFYDEAHLKLLENQFAILSIHGS